MQLYGLVHKYNFTGIKLMAADGINQPTTVELIAVVSAVKDPVTKSGEANTGAISAGKFFTVTATFCQGNKWGIV